ncbi:hypothetical protein K440DRAFT_247625 [Wilcoxina mikolae CBS 423.85]|nr:hypothetical protein K440DRAFT_247625 [Wilcoxina mikolae CBS 423.85]
MSTTPQPGSSPPSGYVSSKSLFDSHTRFPPTTSTTHIIPCPPPNLPSTTSPPTSPPKAASSSRVVAANAPLPHTSTITHFCASSALSTNITPPYDHPPYSLRTLAS